MATPEVSTTRRLRLGASGLDSPADRAVLASARAVRRFGMTGALLMAVGSLGAGALPVPNPMFGLRLLGLPSRNATVSIAVT